MDTLGHLLAIDPNVNKSGVVSSLISYSRSQTFLSGSNLASGSALDIDELDSLESQLAPAPSPPLDMLEVANGWDRDRLIKAVSYGDDEFVVGSLTWEDDEPHTPTTLGPSHLSKTPPKSSAPRRQRTRSRPLAPQRQTRPRITSTPTVPSSDITIGAGRGRSSNPSPPSSTYLEGHPASAPVPAHCAPSSLSPDERTPLLTSSSRSSSIYDTPSSTASPASPCSEATLTELDLPSTNPKMLSEAIRKIGADRRVRSLSRPPPPPPGNSTYGQTLFNSIAILLGIGMLSCPLAFACAGWIGGTLLVVFYGFLTCYTAKVLAKIILSDGRLRTYADIGQAAFGKRSNVVTSSLFCLELFAVSVILIVLFSDSLHELLPRWSSNSYKLIGLAVVIPTSFLPLRVLSFASILGILSTMMLVFVLFEDGITKQDAPGSVWESAPTEWVPQGALVSIPISFGLFMAGFSGHAVIPSIVRDMKDPTHYESMINWAFFVATCVYGILGAVGYRMFGHAVSAEVSQDLLRTPGFNQLLNKTALWMLVLSPLSKFSLSARPMHVTIEILLGIEESSPVPSHNRPRGSDTDCHSVPSVRKDELQAHHPHNLLLSPSPSRQAEIDKQKAIWRALERVALVVSVVVVAVYVPDFTTSMAFLGAFSAFALCVIGPLAAKMTLERRVSLMDCTLIVIATVMAVWATYIAITAA